MNPPSELREVCEQLLVLSRSPGTKGQVVLALETLKILLREYDRSMQAFPEYILIPLFLILPGEVEKGKDVPERVVEAILQCFSIIVSSCHEAFGVRADLFLPVLIRALAALSDADREGQLALGLKEETMTEAVLLINALVSAQSTVVKIDDPIVYHCAALLLDIAQKLKSKDLRAESLRAFRELVDKMGVEQAHFMFPGAASSLCEASRWDFKAGAQVCELATDSLRRIVVKVLGDAREIKNGERDEYFEHLYPLLMRIWKHGSEFDVPNQVRIARSCLVNDLLCSCSSVLRKSDAARRTLLSMLVWYCADPEEAVSTVAQKHFSKVRSEFFRCDEASLFNAYVERVLLDSILKMSEVSSLDDDPILSRLFAMTGFLFRTIHIKRVRAMLDVSRTKITWSLLSTFECDASRINELGKIEFTRLTSSLARSNATNMFGHLKTHCPDISGDMSEQLMESAEACLEGAAYAIDDEDDIGGLIQLPKSYLAQALFLAGELCVDHESLFRRLIEWEDIWSLPKKPGSLSPQEIVWNALAHIALLGCLSRCASEMGESMRFELVDCLFPILRSLADDHPGVKIAAQLCLERISAVCGYASVQDLLQENVDYVVDSLVRRLPQLSPSDYHFADVIEVLIDQIPMWRSGEEVSPWIQDLIRTLLTGLDDRANSPRVVWSLLRIANVVVAKASVVISEQQPVSSSAFATEQRRTQDDYVDEVMAELSQWLSPSVNPLETSDDEDEEEEDPLKDSTSDKQEIQSIEDILIKSGLFMSDNDVLVRNQAAQVAIECIRILGTNIPDRAKPAIHQIWPSIVAQLKEEKHPITLTLLLETLSLGAETKIGPDFFTRRFSEDAWPVLKLVLERGISPGQKRQPLARDVELATRVLRALPRLGVMLASRAEDIALVTSRFITKDGSSPETKRLAFEVWCTLAQYAGDVIWLPIAVGVQKECKPKRGLKIVFEDSTLAMKLWEMLEAQ